MTTNLFFVYATICINFYYTTTAHYGKASHHMSISNHLILIIRDGAMNIWKLLLLRKSETMNDILMYQSKGSTGGSLNSGSGESQLIDLRTNGFDLLTTEKDFNKFSFWITSDDVLSLIHFVFDDVLTKTWLNYQTVENANKVDQLKKLKTRRQKRFQKEAKMKADEELKLSRFYSWKATLMESNKLALSRSLTSTKLSLLGTFFFTTFCFFRSPS